MTSPWRRLTQRGTQKPETLLARSAAGQSVASSVWPPQAARPRAITASRTGVRRRRPTPCFAAASGFARGKARPGLSMAPRKPKVIVTRKLPDAVETRMRELFDTELNLDDTPMDAPALAAAMARADVLAPTITDRIDADLIAGAGPKLKLIANFGVGIDHIDVPAAHARGIT